MLLSSERTSLAIHSLLETTLIYGCLYWAMAHIKGLINLFQDIDKYQHLTNNIMAFFVYSFNFDFNYNISKISWNCLLPFQMLQIIVSIILVIMSVAYYMGSDREMFCFDEELYKYCKINETKQML